MSLAPSDFKYAVRLLAKRPWFTALTVIMLAGGLGISLYTYAVLNVMLYRSVPLPEGSSIVKIGAGSWVDIELLDSFELKELRDNASSLSELGVYRASRSLVGESGAMRSVRSVESDWQIFQFTRTQPLLGRGFVPDDNSEASEPVAVLAYDTWQAVFSGDAGVVGEISHRSATPSAGFRPTRASSPASRSRPRRRSSRRWCNACVSNGQRRSLKIPILSPSCSSRKGAFSAPSCSAS